jgi:plastocyanin
MAPKVDTRGDNGRVGSSSEHTFEATGEFEYF